MALQVIGAGYGRTGTASLRVALEALGFTPCYHMFEIRDAPWKAGPWLRIARGAPPDWDAVFHGYRAAIDWPTVFYYRELKAYYPAAKVILTIRDAETWYDSAYDTIYAISRVIPVRIWRWLPGLRTVFAMIDATIWRGTFQGRFADREYAKSVYTEHIETVQRSIPAADLLVFDVRDGWRPLCTFLGVPTPEDRPFPWVNEGKVIKRQVLLMKYLLNCATVGVGVGLAAVAYWLFIA